MLKSNIPCNNCADRKVGCHGECEKYMAFVEANNERRNRERKEKELYAYHKEEANRMFHNEHRKGRFRSNSFR